MGWITEACRPAPAEGLDLRLGEQIFMMVPDIFPVGFIVTIVEQESPNGPDVVSFRPLHGGRPILQFRAWYSKLRFKCPTIWIPVNELIEVWAKRFVIRRLVETRYDALLRKLWEPPHGLMIQRNWLEIESLMKKRINC